MSESCSLVRKRGGSEREYGEEGVDPTVKEDRFQGGEREREREGGRASKKSLPRTEFLRTRKNLENPGKNFSSKSWKSYRKFVKNWKS